MQLSLTASPVLGVAESYSNCLGLKAKLHTEQVASESQSCLEREQQFTLTVFGLCEEAREPKLTTLQTSHRKS